MTKFTVRRVSDKEGSRGKKKIDVPQGMNDLQAPMHSRRLDDRIRELCARLVASTEHHDVNQILSELKVALHESIERLRIRVAGALSGRRDFQDRRKAL
jgi:hypothetical protein